MFILKYTQGIGADSFVKKYDNGANAFTRGSDFDGKNFTIVGNNNLAILGAAFVLKTDAQGTVLWQKAYEGGADDRFVDVETTPNNTVYAVGLTGSEGVGDSNGLIGKFDSSGTNQWLKRVDAPASESFNFSSIISTNDTTIYVAANYTDATSTDIVVMKITPSGTIEWQKRISGVNNELTNFIETDDDGNIYVSGSTAEAGGVGSNDDFYIVKLDPTGTILWQKRYGDSAANSGVGIRVRGGYVYAAGRSISGSPAASDAVIMKIDASDGTLIWARQLNVSSVFELQPNIDLDSSGNVYVTGSGEPPSGTADIYVVKYDNNGTLLWQRSIATSNNNAITQGIAVYGGFVYALGRARNPSFARNDLLVVRLTYDGDSVGVYGSEITIAASSYVDQAASLTSPAVSLTMSNTSFTTVDATLTELNPNFVAADLPLA
jgi:hypothetical protein